MKMIRVYEETWSRGYVIKAAVKIQRYTAIEQNTMDRKMKEDVREIAMVLLY